MQSDKRVRLAIVWIAVFVVFVYFVMPLLAAYMWLSGNHPLLIKV